MTIEIVTREYLIDMGCSEMKHEIIFLKCLICGEDTAHSKMYHWNDKDFVEVCRVCNSASLEVKKGKE